MSLAGSDVSPFSEERHSLLQRHGHLLPLHLAADAVRDVLPRVPPQVDIYSTYCGWCRYLHSIYTSVEPGKPKNWTRTRLFIVNLDRYLFRNEPENCDLYIKHYFSLSTFQTCPDLKCSRCGIECYCNLIHSITYCRIDK